MCEAPHEAHTENRTSAFNTLTISQAQREQLIQYYNRRREALEFCSARFHHAVEDEKQEIIDSVNEGRLSLENPEVQRAIGKLNGPIASTSRNCLLIAVCSLLEDVLRRAGNLALKDYDSIFKKDKNDHREDFLRTHRRILEAEAGIHFEPVADYVGALERAVLIRNSVVHAWGKVETSTHPEILRKTLDEIKWADETQDGYICLYDDAVPEVMWAAEQVIEWVLMHGPFAAE